VDVAACTAAGVCVMNQAGSNAAAVAEHTIGLLLGLSKRIAESDRRLRRGERLTRQQAMGSDLEGTVLGLVGIGHAGTRVSALGRALGMTVLATDPYLSPEEIRHRGAQSVTLQQLLQDANVISLHCPLTPETEGLFGREAFAAMKPGALFITTARGGIHDEVALYDALVSGHLAGAGLDVWAVEPPPADHPLLRLDQVLATTHTAGVSAGARRQMAAMSADQILAFARGERPARLVNPQVWPAFIARYERVMGQPFAGAGALHGN
jgi:D-3-phosphoglycerate dehydrogenase